MATRNEEQTAAERPPFHRRTDTQDQASFSNLPAPSVLDALTDPIAIRDTAFVYRFANAAFCEWLRRPPASPSPTWRPTPAGCGGRRDPDHRAHRRASTQLRPPDEDPGTDPGAAAPPDGRTDPGGIGRGRSADADLGRRYRRQEHRRATPGHPNRTRRSSTARKSHAVSLPSRNAGTFTSSASTVTGRNSSVRIGPTRNGVYVKQV